jgi:hypothetical protein
VKDVAKADPAKYRDKVYVDVCCVDVDRGNKTIDTRTSWIGTPDSNSRPVLGYWSIFSAKQKSVATIGLHCALLVLEVSHKETKVGKGSVSNHVAAKSLQLHIEAS